MGKENFGDGVLIPFLQAVITGCFTGLAVLGLSILFGWKQPYNLGFMAGSVLCLLSWLNYRERWQWRLEKWLKIDLDHDGQIGKPPDTIRVEVIQDEGRIGDYIDLPVSYDKLKALAVGLSAGKPFTVATWTGNGATFTRTEFEALRAEFINRGLARWRNSNAPGQGIELTFPGKAVVKHFSATTPPPLSED